MILEFQKIKPVKERLTLFKILGTIVFTRLTAKWGKHTNKMGPWKVQVV